MWRLLLILETLADYGFTCLNDNCFMNDPKIILQKIDTLINCWCERRCLKPLRYILQHYPLLSGLTDEWGALYESLRDIKGLCQKELNSEEQKTLTEIINAVHDIIHAKRD